MSEKLWKADNAVLREIFRHRGRLCVVIEMGARKNLARTFLEGTLSTAPYCNGYVEVLKKNYGKDYDDSDRYYTFTI